MHSGIFAQCDVKRPEILRVHPYRKITLLTDKLNYLTTCQPGKLCFSNEALFLSLFAS